MTAVISLSLKRVAKHFRKTVFSSFSALVSASFISAFSTSLALLLEFKSKIPRFPVSDGGVADSGSVTLSAFVSDVLGYLSFALVAVAAVSFFAVYVSVRLNSESSEKFNAVLASLGATRAQRAAAFLTETGVNYFLPIIAGAALGVIPGRLFAESLIRLFEPNFASEVPVFLLNLGVIIALLLTTLAFSLIGRGRGSLTERLKRLNKKEAEATHSYRNSNTFRSMKIEKRVAKKTVEYYKPAYRRISIMIAGAVLYLVIAVAFYYAFGSVSVVIDSNPYDDQDTSAFALKIIGSLVLFCTLSLLVLCALGVIQIVLMIKAQNELRRDTMFCYKSVGMTDNGIKKTLSYEYRAVIFNALLYVLIGTVFIFVLV